jgi:hypothetical protein
MRRRWKILLPATVVVLGGCGFGLWTAVERVQEDAARIH